MTITDGCSGPRCCVQVKQHQQDVKKEALASRCLASELAVLREEYSKKSDEVSAYGALNRDLEEENHRLDAALEQGRRRISGLEALAGKVDQLQGITCAPSPPKRPQASASAFFVGTTRVHCLMKSHVSAGAS